MSYYIKIIDDKGEHLHGPIANDNPERDVWDDPRIERKAQYWAKAFQRMDGVHSAEVQIQ